MVDEIKATGANFSTGPIGRLGQYARGVKPVSDQATGVTDRVEFSELGTWLARFSELPQVRTELVDKIRAEIAAGKYESPEKLDVAVENLLDDLTG
jgi:anti-sigma28 factor (negative regulator of flagellin synthesis)